MLIDIHAHMTDERLYKSVDRIVKAMDEDNLCKIVNIGYDRESSVESAVLARKYPKLYAAVGIHPHDAKLATKTDYEYFRSFVSDPKVIAVGEIGLDFFYDKSARDVQERVFLEQLELASHWELPIIVHLRDAYEPMMKLLKDNKAKLQQGGLLHCYSGSKEMLKDFLDLGFYVSYGGAITFKNAVQRQEVVKATPINKILLETDCPYMTPEPHRGEVNEPKYVNLVAAKLSELKDIGLKEIEEVTEQNAYALFPKLKNE